MFKENPEGQTHYQNDGCGELEHNMKTLPDILKEFEDKKRDVILLHNHILVLPVDWVRDFLSKVYAHAIENCLQEITEQKRLFANLPLGKRMNGWDALSDAEQSIKSLLDKEIKE